MEAVVPRARTSLIRSRGSLCDAFANRTKDREIYSPTDSYARRATEKEFHFEDTGNATMCFE